MRIVDANLPSFANEDLQHRDHRTLTHIVGVLLERQADDADVSLGSVEQKADRSTQMLVIAGERGFQQRQPEIAHARAVEERAQVLGETRAAKRESRL